MIGLGTEYLHEQPRETVKAVIAEAVAQGVNYVDVIFTFTDYLDNLGAALAGRREAIILALHLGCAETDGQYRRTREVEECTRNFHDMLRRLGTDHADVIVVQNCDEQEDYDGIMGAGGLLELAERLRQEGKGRFLGFSGHSVPVPTQAAESGRYEVVMTSINVREAGLAQRELYQSCVRENVGLVGMKPFAGACCCSPKGANDADAGAVPELRAVAAGCGNDGAGREERGGTASRPALPRGGAGGAGLQRGDRRGRMGARPGHAPTATTARRARKES